MSDGERDRLVGELTAAARAAGNARDALDQAVADRLAINLSDLRCLDVLEQRDGCGAGEIATALGLSTGAVTTLLDRLEHAGYVQRTRDDDDRRRVQVELTSRTRRLARELYGPLARDAAALFARYDSAELALLRDFHAADLQLQLRQAARIRALGPAAPPAPRDRRPGHGS